MTTMATATTLRDIARTYPLRIRAARQALGEMPAGAARDDAFTALDDFAAIKRREFDYGPNHAHEQERAENRAADAIEDAAEHLDPTQTADEGDPSDAEIDAAYAHLDSICNQCWHPAEGHECSWCGECRERNRS